VALCKLTSLNYTEFFRSTKHWFVTRILRFSSQWILPTSDFGNVHHSDKVIMQLRNSRSLDRRYIYMYINRRSWFNISRCFLFFNNLSNLFLCKCIFTFFITIWYCVINDFLKKDIIKMELFLLYVKCL